MGKELTKKGFNFVTTLRSNTCILPDKNLLANSSNHYAYDNNNKCIIHQFEDKKTINFFTNTQYSSVKSLRNDYNVYNRGVDKMNQNLSYNKCQRNFTNIGKNYSFLG